MGQWETQAKKASSRISFLTSMNERFSSLHFDKNKSTNSHKSFRDKFMFFFLVPFILLLLRLHHISHSKWREKKENLPDYCLILIKKNVFGWRMEMKLLFMVCLRLKDGMRNVAVADTTFKPASF